MLLIIISKMNTHCEEIHSERIHSAKEGWRKLTHSHQNNFCSPNSVLNLSLCISTKADATQLVHANERIDP